MSLPPTAPTRDKPRNGGAPPTVSHTRSSLCLGKPHLRKFFAKNAAVALLLLLPIITVAVSFWPGHMSADTLSQIQQVRTGDFTNLHAPLLMWIWRPFYLHLGAGPGWVLTAQLLTFVLGCYLVLRAAFRPT